MDNLIKSKQELVAQKTKGESSNDIYKSILEVAKTLPLPENPNILDFGCGKGLLLQQLSKTFPAAKLFGIDSYDHPKVEIPNFTFCQWNSEDENSHTNSLQANLPRNIHLIICSEVIEHFENPWAMMRILSHLLEAQQHILLTTPNIDAFASVCSFAIRGYHQAFGPKNFPEHKTPLNLHMLKNIIAEIDDLTLLRHWYLPNGRIPGTRWRWHSFFPFLTSKRFADNFLVHIYKGGKTE